MRSVEWYLPRGARHALSTGRARLPPQRCSAVASTCPAAHGRQKPVQRACMLTSASILVHGGVPSPPVHRPLARRAPSQRVPPRPSLTLMTAAALAELDAVAAPLARVPPRLPPRPPRVSWAAKRVCRAPSPVATTAHVPTQPLGRGGWRQRLGVTAMWGGAQRRQACLAIGLMVVVATAVAAAATWTARTAGGTGNGSGHWPSRLRDQDRGRRRLQKL